MARTDDHPCFAQEATAPPVTDGDCAILGIDPATVELRSKLRRLASYPYPVLLLGETGTGKELAAQMLHQSSARAKEPFVALNCGAIPEHLAESELFGHRRGAFTGACRDHRGAFVQAGRGTLFLDEVAELPPTVQAKLLRVLETGSARAVGSEQEFVVHARIVSATLGSVDPSHGASALRADLYHRLAVFQIELPPLRERRRDIAPLLHHFTQVASRELGKSLHVHSSAIEAAQAYPWPGNIRELRNRVLRATALTDDPLDAEKLALPELASEGPALRSDERFISIPRGNYAQMNRALLRQVVRESGSIRKAAHTLGIPRSTLGGWLRRGGDGRAAPH